jgi:hypothetical protein
MIILIVFVVFVSADPRGGTLSILQTNVAAYNEKVAKLSVPSFASYCDAFFEELRARSLQGETCFSYSSSAVDFFFRLALTQEPNDVWLYIKNPTVQEMIATEIARFPSYWADYAPDIPIAGPDKDGLYTVCWSKK